MIVVSLTVSLLLTRLLAAGPLPQSAHAADELSSSRPRPTNPATASAPAVQAQGAEEILPVISFPDPAATMGGSKISAQEARFLAQGVPNLGKLASLDDQKKLLRRFFAEELYYRELEELLQKSGIPDLNQAGADLLRRYEKALPPELSQDSRFRENFQKYKYEKNFRFSAGFYASLQKNHPEKLKVPAEEIERFYREHQLQFLTGSTMTLGFVGASKETSDAKRKIREARARLLQGELFETIAEEYNSKLPKSCYDGSNPPVELLKMALKVQEGTLSEVMENNQMYFLLRLNRKMPPGYVSPEKASALIELHLQNEIVRGELMRLLMELAGRHPVRFFF
ncbi:MAG: peptidylprolyl isomerase [Victivallaceae bacterium]|nr:peptidylprolyl isomerase [Victivallaceae bacterium]